MLSSQGLIASHVPPKTIHSRSMENRRIFAEMTGGPQLLHIYTDPVFQYSQGAVRTTNRRKSELLVAAGCLGRCLMLRGVKLTCFTGKPQIFQD